MSVKKILLSFSILFSVVYMISCSKSSTTSDTIVNFTAKLDGIQEVPSNSSIETGTSTGTYNMTTKVLTVTTTHSISGATNGHIHLGAEGVAGPVEFPFASFTSPISFNTTLTAAQETNLLNNQYYVNIHTAAFPAGEIRGQLMKEGTSTSNLVNFNATVNGSQEVPANASTYAGLSTGTFNKTTKILTVTTTHTVPAPTNGHIHVGVPGVAGPVVYPFTTFTSPIVFTSTALTNAQIADLMNNKNYVNIHTAAFPAGEIRGQLIKQ